MNVIFEGTQTVLNRSIEHALYKTLLSLGYIPDREQFAGNRPGYDQKKKEIKERKGFAVSLFGHGSPADRDNLLVPKIVVTGQGFSQGPTGNDPLVSHHENLEGGYDQILGPLRSSVYRFDIELTSNKTDQDNLLEYVRVTALPDLYFVPVYNNPGDTFLIQYGSVRNIPDFSHGLIKKVYQYAVVDVFENLARTVGQVTKIKEITLTDDQGNPINSISTP